jgi:hypothetical protein
MRKLLPAFIASAFLCTASTAVPLLNSGSNGPPGESYKLSRFLGPALFSPLHLTVAIPEPATNVLLICGLFTIGGLAIFLGKKLG